LLSSDPPLIGGASGATGDRIARVANATQAPDGGHQHYALRVPPTSTTPSPQSPPLLGLTPTPTAHSVAPV